MDGREKARELSVEMEEEIVFRISKMLNKNASSSNDIWIKFKMLEKEIQNVQLQISKSSYDDFQTSSK